MRQSELATLFDFMYWANRRILQTAARLTVAQFTLPSVIAGRDLRATLVHTLDTECSWRLRLQGREKEGSKALALSDYRNVAALADHWARDEAEMRAWVASLDDDVLTRTPDDPRAHFPLWYYLLHVVTHSSNTARNRRSCSRSSVALQAISIFWITAASAKRIRLADERCEAARSRGFGARGG
jgi:uncharacterized damage-inducible protein DinB